MGAIRKHEHLKLLSGTARPSRPPPAGPALEALDVIPAPPDWLSRDGVAEWNRLAPTLHAAKLLTIGNLQTFAQVCALAACFAESWRKGEVPQAALLSAHRAASRELGLFTVKAPSDAKENRFYTNRIAAKA